MQLISNVAFDARQHSDNIFLHSFPQPTCPNRTSSICTAFFCYRFQNSQQRAPNASRDGNATRVPWARKILGKIAVRDTHEYACFLPRRHGLPHGGAITHGTYLGQALFTPNLTKSIPLRKKWSFFLGTSNILSRSVYNNSYRENVSQ